MKNDNSVARLPLSLRWRKLARASFAMMAQAKTPGLGVSAHFRWRAYAAPAASSIGSTIEGSSFSGLLTRVEIGHIRIEPDEWMELLDIARCATIFFAAVNLDGASFSELNRDNARCRIAPEEQGVLFEFHFSTNSYFILRN